MLGFFGLETRQNGGWNSQTNKLGFGGQNDVALAFFWSKTVMFWGTDFF